VLNAVRFAAVVPVSPTLPPVAPSVHTVFGTGTPGHTSAQTNDPFGLAPGPDGALHFCEMEGQRVRRLDFTTGLVTTIAGNGERAYRGGGGQAIDASFNMRFGCWTCGTGIITTVLGAVAGGGWAGIRSLHCRRSRPHGLLMHPQGGLLVADSEAHRVRLLH
jgi:hypothetical protein